MVRRLTVLVTSLLASAGWVALAAAQPTGIGIPTSSAGPLQAGTDTLTFSGAPITLLSLDFGDKQCQSVAALVQGAAALKLSDGNWTESQRGLALKGSGPGSLRCRIPTEAAGLVLKYLCAGGVFDPVTLALNGAEVQLAPFHDGTRQTLVPLTKNGDQFQPAGEPRYNLWDLQGTPPGPRNDEVQREIDYSPAHSPLTGNGYCVHVSFVARPESVTSPDASAYIPLHGVDVTQYDGYYVSVKSPDARYFSTSLGDSNGFAWSGAGMRLEPEEWTSIAVPFELHRNYTTAGDGVLKLSELTNLSVNIGGRPGDAPLTGEFWVRNPVFYKGSPPKGIPVAKKPLQEACAVRNLSPERRKPHFFEGVSIQTMCRQGDTLWLGTDRGLIKSSLSQPGLPMAQYSVPEGLVDDDVQTLYADGQNLWIGTTCGLSRFDGKEFENFTSENGLLPGPVLAVTSNDKYLWFGMARGIARYDKSSGQIVARKGSGGWAPESTGGQGVPIQEGRGVYADSIALDADGSLWHAAAGIWHSTSDCEQKNHYLGTTHRVLSIHPPQEGVWLVSAYAIELMEREEGLIKSSYGIHGRQGIHGEHHDAFITCAYPEPDGIWLGYSDGVGWFDPKEKKCYWSPSFSVALGSLVPQSLFADARSVWVGTDNGLLVFPRARAQYTWTSLEYSAPADVWAAGVDMDPEEIESGDRGRYGQGAYSVTLDDEEGVPGSPGALLLAFNLGKDAKSKALMSQRFDMEVTGANAFAFCAKTDGRAREFFVDLRVDVKEAGRTRSEVWRAQVSVGTKWQRFTVPFSTMRLVADNGRGSPMTPDALHLTGVDFSRSVADFQCPEDSGKLWVDKLEWKSLRAGGRA